MRKFLAIAFFSISISTHALADTIVLKNGDKLSGTLVAVRDKKLSFKSDMIGDLVIALDKVQSFIAEKPAVILGTDQTTVRGQTELEPSGDWKVTSDGQPQVVAGAIANVVLPESTYHDLFEQSAHVWQQWKGAINFGYAVQRGDQKTRTVNSVIKAVRERSQDLLFTPHWRTNYGLNMLYAKAKQDGIEVNSTSITTALREDYLFTAHDFVFAFAQLDHIGPQGLYLRQTFGGGLGRDLIHSQRVLFSGIMGANYLRERFIIGPHNISGEGAVGEKLGIQINSRIRLDHDINFYPDLRRSARYHADASLILGMKINQRFSANAGVLDQYISRPAPGSRNNNVAFTTGFGYIF
jgi:putative salt-induced outer membrane protein YdiY